VRQLRFARREFVRCLEGLSDEDARRRLMPMNCISWMVGHMAAQEQFYFVYFAQGEVPWPNVNKLVGFGQPASTPPLADMWDAWHDITQAADRFLTTLTEEQLWTHLTQDVSAGAEILKSAVFGIITKERAEALVAQGFVRSDESVGTKVLRTTYHYFFHTGEAHAVRQQLGHADLPYFVGDMPDNLF